MSKCYGFIYKHIGMVVGSGTRYLRGMGIGAIFVTKLGFRVHNNKVHYAFLKNEGYIASERHNTKQKFFM